MDLAKYAPLGNCGFIKGRGCGFGYQEWAAGTLEEYMANSNEKLMVIPQCETAESLSCIEEIAALEGIDGVANGLNSVVGPVLKNIARQGDAEGGKFMGLSLWDAFETWKASCRWVELSREVSPKTPHHSAFPEMETEMLYDYDKGDTFQAHVYKTPGQYGTHVDAPIHMSEGAKGLDAFGASDLCMPLCVIDLSKEVAADPDYALGTADIEAWEARNGKIPEGAFVAFRSDWGKRGTYEEIENRDEEGTAHYPGWTVEALKFLREERGVLAVGHEPADTDPAVIANTEGWIAERYWLAQNRYQIELLVNLDQCPETGGLIFCAFPRLKGGSGSTARCVALVPRA